MNPEDRQLDFNKSGQDSREARPVQSRARWIALVGLFAALYIVAAGLVAFVSSLGYPEHLIRGILMTALVAQARRKWSATLMGVAAGVVFFVAVPAPAPYLLASTLASGLVFDLVLFQGGSYSKSTISRNKLVLGAALSGIAESLVVLGILTTFSPKSS